jgi:serine/threonine protein kinase
MVLLFLFLTTRSTEFGCGSVRYESPECLTPSFNRYRPRASDIWSLGVILINILVGKNPWCEPSMQDEMFREYSETEGFFFRHFSTDADVIRILSGCLEIDVSNRWDINELCESIDGLLNVPPDSAIDMPSEMIPDAFLKVGSWGSDAQSMDFNEVPVFPGTSIAVEISQDEEREKLEFENDVDLDKTLVAHEIKTKKKGHRQRKHQNGKHVEKVEVEGLMIKMAAAFSKLITPLSSRSSLLAPSDETPAVVHDPSLGEFV